MLHLKTLEDVSWAYYPANCNSKYFKKVFGFVKKLKTVHSQMHVVRGESWPSWPAIANEFIFAITNFVFG